jgi:Ca-activated chloride channel family protein
VTELHLLRPWWLLSLLPLLAIWWALRRRQDAMGQLRSMIDPCLLEHLLVGGGAKRRLRPIHLLGLIWVLSALALAGPTWEREPSPFAEDDAGLMVLLKVSGTMEATDVQPTRLARAKQKLQDLLALREGQSTGLIVYSGSAHLVIPLTRDGRIIIAMIEDLTPT